MNALFATLLALTMRAGVRYTGWRWRFIAKVRRQIDGHRCTKCHSNGRMLHVHHKRAVAAGGNYFLWNLRTLCAACHEQAHGWDIDRDGRIA